MRVLFLDIDGVLCSTRTCVAFGGYPMELHHQQAFDRAAIGLLQRLCDSAGIQVVLSSAWRKHCRWQDAAKAFGLPIIGATPDLCGKPRGAEIAAWLAEHPQVKQYAIVDDDCDMLDGQRACFVRTDADEGLTWGNYLELCGVFGEEPYAGEARHREWQTQKLDWSETGEPWMA